MSDFQPTVQRPSIQGPTDQKHQSLLNRLNFAKEFIRINKNQIGFGSLSPQIKYIFIQSLNEIAYKNIIKEVFYRWKDQDDRPTHGRRIQLNDQDGVSLIWRMQRSMIRKRMNEESQEISKQYNFLKNTYKEYQQSLKNMNEKEKELNFFSLQREEIEKKETLLRKMKNFKELLQEKMKDVERKMRIKEEERRKIEERNNFNYHAPQMNVILTKTISKQVRNLLRDSIVGIVQTSHCIIPEGQKDESDVYVLFEQAYNTKKIKRKTLIKIIGSTYYLQKVGQFNTLMETRQLMSPEQKTKEGNVGCCHICMKLYPKSFLKYCHTSTGPSQTDSYTSSDYYSYRKVYIEGDYFNKSQEQHVLPFFVYNKNSKDKFICNRAFCHECIKMLLPEQQTHFSCLYCKGKCGCRRCEKAVGIVKMIALDYQNDPHQTKKYHQILRLFSQGHPKVEEILPLRLQNTINEAQLMEEVWIKCEREHSKQIVNFSFFQNYQIGQFEALKEPFSSTFPPTLKFGYPNPLAFNQMRWQGNEELPLLQSSRNLITDEQFQNQQWMMMNQVHRYQDSRDNL